MTAKEKAEELVTNYYNIVCEPIPIEYRATRLGIHDKIKKAAKRCALIVCENEYKSLREMLFNLRACKVIEPDSVYLHHIQNLIEEEKEVKQEIEKL